jgi:hypothetical protein
MDQRPHGESELAAMTSSKGLPLLPAVQAGAGNLRTFGTGVFIPCYIPIVATVVPPLTTPAVCGGQPLASSRHTAAFTPSHSLPTENNSSIPYTVSNHLSFASASPYTVSNPNTSRGVPPYLLGRCFRCFDPGHMCYSCKNPPRCRR